MSAIGYAEHPRVRGENRLGPRTGRRQYGTSPRTRGKREHPCQGSCCRRNIPAYAGKTKVCVMGDAVAQEHPRVRGENEAD